MDEPLELPDTQVDRAARRGSIVLLVLDGLGGLAHEPGGTTELETARTPNLDALAGRASLGALVPVEEGITPGSGPGHLSLFGYDPTRFVIGRGVLSALGVGVELRPGDVAARLNLATIDDDGVVTDRRAGRPSDEEAARVVRRLSEHVEQPADAEILLTHEKEHRVVLRIRGAGLGANLSDTDPLEEGRAALPVEAGDEASRRTAAIVEHLLRRSREILADEPVIRGLLARGWDAYEPVPSVQERFGLTAMAFAKYPMYRGVASLVGMAVPGVPDSFGETIALLEERWGEADLYFVHFKDPDTRGHDGDFEGKVAAIEEVDALLPRVTALEPDVLVVTGDHSTPATLREHSWHAVPTLLASRWARVTSATFGERACAAGDLGRIRGWDLMPLALAHAGRLVKFGA